MSADSRQDILQMSRQRGIWLFDYDDIKYKTPFGMCAWLVLGTGALVGGFAVLWLTIGRWSNHANLLSKVITLVIPAAMICYGIAFAPAAFIYFLRRRRGEPVALWDHERARAAAGSGKKGYYRTGVTLTLVTAKQFPCMSS